MKQIMCSKCGIRPAVIFMTRMDGDKSSHQEGLCLKCAMESTGPIKQMMENMGITEDDYEAMSRTISPMFPIRKLKKKAKARIKAKRSRKSANIFRFIAPTLQEKQKREKLTE